MLEDAQQDEAEGNGVRADHPLPMLNNLSITSQNYSGQRASSPDEGMNPSPNHVLPREGHVESKCGGYENGKSLNTPEYSMQLKAAVAKTAGELERSGEECG